MFLHLHEMLLVNCHSKVNDKLAVEEGKKTLSYARIGKVKDMNGEGGK